MYTNTLQIPLWQIFFAMYRSKDKFYKTKSVHKYISINVCASVSLYATNVTYFYKLKQ